MPARRWTLVLFAALTALSIGPIWIPRILPMQDYPQILVLARAFGDCRDPSTPFFGTYTTGFLLAPLLLPILALRALALPFGLETAGRLLWTLYAIGLPASAAHLLGALGHDRRGALLVFPIAISAWVLGGFFAFATAAPLVLFGLALAVRWLEAPTARRGAGLAAVFVALHLWHALALAQLALDLVLLCLLRRGGLARKARALAPMLPAAALFVAWCRAAILVREGSGGPVSWPAFGPNALSFLDHVVPDVPAARIVTLVLAPFVIAGAVVGLRRSRAAAFGVESPLAVLGFVAAACFLAFPADGLGVQGLGNRQPWFAALFLALGARLPGARLRAGVLALASAAAVVTLGDLTRRFTAFDVETRGASRLIDRLRDRETLLAPMRGGASTSIPGKPLTALELYASIRHGGLPSSSFAGYPINLVHYVDANPMPGLAVDWLESPELKRYDYVLLRGGKEISDARLRPTATDGAWTLYAVTP